MNYRLLAVMLANLALTSHSHAEVDLVIKDATIISPQNKYESQVLSNSWVAIKGNRIVDIGQNQALPSAKRVINAKGKFLIPGLMDSHTHLLTMPGLDFDDLNANHMQEAYAERRGNNFLYYGVTQVLDPATTELGVKYFQASSTTPDAFYCGAMPIFNGYNARGIAHEDLHHRRPYYVAEQTDPQVSPELQSIHTATKAVERLVDDGANCAKVFIEDGFNFADHIPIMSQQNLTQLVQRAKQLKLPVMAHANATDMQAIAIEADVTILAHGLWNWLEEQKLDKQTEFPPKVKKVLDKIVAQDVIYQPTMNVLRALRDVMVQSHLALAEYKNVLPQWQIDWYLSQQGQWYAEQMAGESRTKSIQSFNAKMRNGTRVVKYLYDRGVTILLASDTPPSPTYASQPGLSSYMELQMLHQAGLDLAGILSAATLNNAKAYRLDRDYGTVSKGKIANLLLLDSDPLKSIQAYDDINTVVLQGKPIARSKLHINALQQAAPAVSKQSVRLE